MSRSETVAGERLTEGERGAFKFDIVIVYAFSSTLLRREPPPRRSLNVHSIGILPSEEMEHSIRASSVICAHIIPSGKHEPQRDGGSSADGEGIYVLALLRRVVKPSSGRKVAGERLTEGERGTSVLLLL